jgi:drug/metabolite transporter (DMT)-like permease
MTSTQNHQEPSKALIIAAFAALYIIWGSTYLGILYAIKSIPPLLMAGTRFTIAGLLLITWCFIKKEKLPSKSSLGIIALSGLLMLFIGNGAVTWVEQYLPSGLAAIIVATTPLWFVLLDKRQWHYHFSNKWIIIGLLVGFAGVLLLFAGKSSGDMLGSPIKIISFFVLIAGTAGWAVGSLVTKYKSVDGSTLMKVALQMLVAGVAFFISGFMAKEHQQFSWSQVSSTSVIALSYLILFGSLVGYLSYIWLLGVRPPSLVGTYAYVNPIVAVFLGWLFVGEAIGQQQVIALSVILLGVILVNLAKEKKTNPIEVTIKRQSEPAVQVCDATGAK